MPPRTFSRRLTVSRWSLTALAVLLLTVWLVTRWGGVSYTSAGGSGVSLYAGVVGLGANPGGTGLTSSGVQWLWKPDAAQWNFVASYIHRASGEWLMQCTLLLPALFAAWSAGWLWYRRWRPADRPNQPVSQRRRAAMRWTLSALAVLLMVVATASHWYTISFHDPGMHFDGVRGMIVISNNGFPLVPGPVQQGWSLTPVRPLPAVPGGRGTSVFLLLVSRFATGGFMAMVSLWFLTALAAIPAIVLWHSRLRHSVLGGCAHCQHDLTGLAKTTPCPECGQGSAT